VGENETGIGAQSERPAFAERLQICGFQLDASEAARGGQLVAFATDLQ